MKTLQKLWIWKKWLHDTKSLNHLTKLHKQAYFNIHTTHQKRTGNYPNIQNPITYNDKIAWLALFDHSEKQILYSDKIAVREFIQDAIGGEYLPNLYQVADNFDQIDFTSLPHSFVMKSNHDSGTVKLIQDKINADFQSLSEQFTKAMDKPYGIEKGEWFYSHIKPKILVEEYIHTDSGFPPADFKFHCVNGKVVWLQYIFDRGSQTKEIITDRNFIPMPLQLDTDFICTQTVIQKPTTWDKMIGLAEKLATDFKYVRIDLYNENERILFGEMTFLPRAGCYVTKDLEKFGALMQFDTSTVKTPIGPLIKGASNRGHIVL